MFACVYSPDLEKYSSLVDCAYAFSPLVEETAENTVVLDIEGCDLLFGSTRDIAKEIARHAAKLGLKANVAVAQNPDAAIHAARYFTGVTVIPPGKEAKRLGDLPLAALDISLARVETDCAAKLLETLEVWGIRSFSEFAVLPEKGVAERLGPEGLSLQKLARGQSDRPLLLEKPAPGFEKSIELDDPIELLEPLSFILARLLNQLCANLQAHGLAVDELKLRLKLEDKTEQHRAIRLPFPMRDSRVFLKLLLLDIESHPPKCAIIAASIICEPAKPRSIQNGLFQPLAPEPEKLELTLARLTRLVGENNVGSPELVDSHRPGAFRIKRFILKRETRRRGARGRREKRGRQGDGATGRRGEGETGRRGEEPRSRGGEGQRSRGERETGRRGEGATESRSEGGTGRRGEGATESRGEGATERNGKEAKSSALPLSPSPLLPVSPSPLLPLSPSPLLPLSPSLPLLGFRVFRPPLRAEVEAPDGWPARIKAQAGAGRSIRGKILRVAGPWRTSGDWWAEDRWARDEWDVTVAGSASQEGGTLYRIYRDLRSDGWFVEGVYD